MTSPLVSVIILNYNGMPYVDRCLSSVLSSDYPNFEVIFVDNASNDGSLEHVKRKFSKDSRLKIVANNKNYGFAEGNNIGIRASKGAYIALLNVDTEVEPSWLSELVKILDKDKTIGAAQSKLLRMNDPKRFDTCGHMLTQHGFTIERGAGEKDLGQYDYVADILGAKGAAIMIRRSTLDRTGLFDPDYFVLREETDLCWRIWLSGYRVVFVPKSIVYHAGGGTLRDEAKKSVAWRRMQLFYWYRNQLMNLVKNLEFRNMVKVIPFHLLLAFGDSIIRSLRNKNTQQLLCLVKAIAWILVNFKEVWCKHLKVNYLIRKIRDKDILPKIIMKSTILEKLRERARVEI
ncbi:MAG: glycosyltransferase family 2 protein [Nitrososphaeria archaeon]